METAALEEGEPGAEDEPGADEVRPSESIFAPLASGRAGARHSVAGDPHHLRRGGRSTHLLGKLAFRMRDVLLMILVAGVHRPILNPMVLYVQRRVPRRGGAVAIVIGWATLVFIGLAFLFGHPLVTGLTHLSTKPPLYVREAADGTGPVGELVGRFHLQTWVAQNSPKLKSPWGTTLAKPALDFGKGAASVLNTLVTIFALALLLMLKGPISSGVLSGLSPARAERWSRARARSTSR